MVKKTLALMLTLMLVVPLVIAAANNTSGSQAETIMPESYVMEGTILQIDAESLLIRNTDGVQIQVNFNHATAFGIGGDLVAGDIIRVTYNGMMSRSIPSQIHADAIISHRLQGTITSLTDQGFILTDENTIQHTVISDRVLPEGSQCTLWYDGTQTEGAILAWHVRGPQLTGIITGVDKDGILLDVGTEECIILIDSDTLLVAMLEAGASIRVAVTEQLLLSIPAQYHATEILPR